MKKNILSLISIGLLSVLLLGCEKDNKMFEGSDNLITITRDLSSFERIIADDDLDVNVIQSDTRLVEIVVNDNLQNQIITRVNNNTLEISLENGSYRKENFEVNIQIPNLESLQLNDNTRANVNFTSNELAFDVNDSSTLSLRGSANILNIDNSDAGLIEGFSFTTEVLRTSSSDASELEITCNGELNGTVKDASEVRYRGIPTINAQTSDIGQIKDAN